MDHAPSHQRVTPGTYRVGFQRHIRSPPKRRYVDARGVPFEHRGVVGHRGFGYHEFGMLEIDLWVDDVDERDAVAGERGLQVLLQGVEVRL